MSIEQLSGRQLFSIVRSTLLRVQNKTVRDSMIKILANGPPQYTSTLELVSAFIIERYVAAGCPTFANDDALNKLAETITLEFIDAAQKGESKSDVTVETQCG
jgi:hypothetical protein